MLRQRIGRHGGDQHEAAGGRHGHEQAVECVAFKGNRRLPLDADKTAEIIQGGACHIQPGRKQKQLVNGLEGIDHRIVDGQQHERAQQQQEKSHQKIASRRAGNAPSVPQQCSHGYQLLSGDAVNHWTGCAVPGLSGSKWRS